jgi:hypothetical protein
MSIIDKSDPAASLTRIVSDSDGSLVSNNSCRRATPVNVRLFQPVKSIGTNILARLVGVKSAESSVIPTRIVR